MMIYILVPAYNEAVSLGDVIHDLRRHGWNHILVVNDGSEDATAQVAKTYGASFITLPIRRGQGAAIQAGLEYIVEYCNADIVVTFDGDGQHSARDITRLIHPIVRHEADIVLGSRFLRKESKREVPFTRMCLLKVAIWFTRFMTGLSVTDTHNGLRAFSSAVYPKIIFRHRDMVHASELFDMIAAMHWRWCEVPVRIHYTDRTLHKGQHNKDAFRIAGKYIMMKLLS